MNTTKRPLLLTGLVITTFEIVYYIIAKIFSKSNEPITNVIFTLCIIMLIINVKSFYTINLSAKEFKKKMYLPWLSFAIAIIYSFFILIVIILDNKNGKNTTLMVANLFVILSGCLLYIPGILKKIIDNKISYEEHIEQKNK